MTMGSAFQERRQLARQFHEAGPLEQAQRSCKVMLISDSKQADAWHVLGVAALQQGKAEQGVEYLNRAISLRPRMPSFYVNLAEGYLLLGQSERALGCCRVALQLQPEYADAVHVLGQVYLALDRKEDALTYFQLAIRLRAGTPAR